jgi:hypothetical protein
MVQSGGAFLHSTATVPNITPPVPGQVADTISLWPVRSCKAKNTADTPVKPR